MGRTEQPLTLPQPPALVSWEHHFQKKQTGDPRAAITAMLLAKWKREGAVPVASPASEPEELPPGGKGARAWGQPGRKSGRTRWPLGCACGLGKGGRRQAVAWLCPSSRDPEESTVSFKTQSPHLVKWRHYVSSCPTDCGGD